MCHGFSVLKSKQYRLSLEQQSLMMIKRAQIRNIGLDFRFMLIEKFILNVYIEFYP